MRHEKTYDVMVLDGGFAGSVISAILARQGLRVLIIEAKGHPRFSVGESTVPQTSWMMRAMAARYDLPELEDMTSFKRVSQRISPACGVKRNFGFVYHRPGEPQRLDEANQVGATLGDDSESHLLRQDVDSYYFRVAIRYGAEMRHGVKLTQVEIDEQGVHAVTSTGEALEARFLIDSTGPGSVLARKLGLREEPTRCKAHSRSLFTHMVDVTPYEECVSPRDGHRMPSKWSQGTLHHVFDGGWLWVIPFDNYPGHVNSAVSVGLSLDPRREPKPEGSPEDEFKRFLQRFPSIAVQFERARTVRDWVSTDRIQYSSRRCCGYRYALLSHTMGFIDALFSRGLVNTTESINMLVPVLLRALRDDDFSVERFAHVERAARGFIDYNDRLVNCSYIAFRDYELWNAWHRIWVLGAVLGVLRVQRAKMRFDETGDKRFLESLDHMAHPGSLSPDHDGFNALLERLIPAVEAVEAGRRTAADVTDEIYERLAGAPFALPVFPFTDRNARYSITSQATVKFVLDWVRAHAPDDMRRLYFDVKGTEWLEGNRPSDSANAA